MKVILVLLLLALAGAAAYQFYLKDHPLSWSQNPELATSSTTAGNSGSATESGKKDFKELSARLQGSMDHIPISLREPRQIPNYALDTRSKLASYIQLHAEYATVTQVCDLIIDADQAFAEHQEKCGLVPAGPGASAQERARTPVAPTATALRAQQTIWDNRRLQADSKVRQLLATLENRRL